MLLTISTTHNPATDLGYLLHKNPARLQTEELSFGKAHVFYPEADSERCTVALLLEVDPIALVRGRRGPAGEGDLFRDANPLDKVDFVSPLCPETSPHQHSSRYGIPQELLAEGLLAGRLYVMVLSVAFSYWRRE